MALSKISKNWTISIPKKVRDVLNCKKDDIQEGYIVYIIDGNQVRIVFKKEEDIKFK